MRTNNFDIVRLLLAMIVVFVHASDLSGSSALAFLPKVLSSSVAVEGFFAISGFLIFASCERSQTIKDYFSNRAFRILPGYWVSTALCVAIAIASGHFAIGKFLVANLTFLNFLHPGIPGVFENIPGPKAMNGALWTIKVEVMFYVAVPLMLWLCRRFRRDGVLWALITLSILWRTHFFGHDKLGQQLPGQLSFFLVGTLIYYHLETFKRYGLGIMIVAALLYCLHIFTGWFFPRPFAISALTLGACLLAPHVQGPARWGDFSYGTYVLHFPILQTLIALGLFSWSPWAGLGVALPLVALGAALSWIYVEKPALQHSKTRRLARMAPVESAGGQVG